MENSTIGIVRRISIIVSLLSISVYLIANQNIILKSNVISTKDGLSNSHITCIKQDSKGYMWIGTRNGLNRFDGKSIFEYQHNKGDSGSLIGNAITSLLVDAKQNLWIATNLGLCSYNAEGDNFIQNPLIELKNFPINSIYKDRKDDIWFCTNGRGIYRYSKELKLLEVIQYSPKQKKGLASNVVLGIVEDYLNNYWIATSDSGISVYNPSSKQFSNFKHISNDESSLSNDFVFSLYEDSRKNMWVSTLNGLNRFNRKAGNFKNYFPDNNPKSIPSPIVYNAVEDKQKNVWIATNKGVCTYNEIEDNFNRIAILPSTSKNEIGQFTHLFIDNQNNIWSGTPSDGVVISYNDDQNFSANSFICNTLKGISVLRILKDKKGFIWIGTDGYGLYCFSPGNNTFRHYPKLPENFSQVGGTSVFALYEDREGALWTGTYKGGLCKKENGQSIFKQYPASNDRGEIIGNNDIRDIIGDDLGNLWIATNGGGVCVLDAKTNTSKLLRQDLNTENSLISDWCLRLLKDNNGRVWISTYSGVSIYNPNKYSFKNFYATENTKSLSNNWVYQIYKDASQNIWLASAEGLNLFDNANESFKNYYKSFGLPDNSINGILEDNSGKYWISTNKGISQVSFTDSSIVNFNLNDGLQGLEYNPGACYKDNLGYLYFGGLQGINIINPLNIKRNLYVPPVFIQKVRINNKPVNQVGNISIYKSINYKIPIILKYDQSTITFEFAALNFIDPLQNKFKYKLEGFDNEWIDAENRNFCTYTNLSPGKYRFFVKGSNNNNIWNTNPASFIFIINPPFWRTWWAYSIYALIILGLFATYRRFTLIKLNLKNKVALEQFKREKAEELNQLKIRFFTNISHEFRTPLSLIIAPVERMLNSKAPKKEELQLVYKNAVRLNFLIDQLMEFRKIETGKLHLNLQRADIVAFVEQIAKAFDNIALQRKIEYNVTILQSPIFVNFDPAKFEIILFNLLSNAFKYTENSGKIELSIDIVKSQEGASQFFEIQVINNGIGIPSKDLEKIFSEYYRSDLTAHLSGTGLGLALTKELVELHHGTITVQSNQNCTCFSIRTPYSEDLPNETIDSNYNYRSDYFKDLVEFELSESEPITNKAENQAQITDIDNSVILIVEDNSELRKFMSKIISEKFNVIEASNGKVGYELAINESPDLILSDIMMPIMNGIQFTKLIKENTQTSHIPILLITADNSPELQIEGLKSGAVDFITKPFSENGLLLKIINIIEKRKKLQEKFKREILLEPREILASSADEKFMLQIMTAIESNIKNNDFDIVEYAAEIGISRTVLFRKMNKLFNETPNDFVNTIRLKKAAQMLKNTSFKVAEVAYEVGFKDPLYFSKCFKKQFNISPSDFLKNSNIEKME